MTRNQWVLAALWTLAVLVALINALGVLHRAPILRREANGPDEQAVQAAARWLRALPPNARVLLLTARRDPRPVWFHFRLNYLAYPRTHEGAWDTLPAGVDRKFDFVMAYHSAQAAVPASWTRLARVERASLFAPAGQPRDRHVLTTEPPSKPISLLRGLAGLFGMSLIVILGALLLGRTTRSPFAAWWANLALAHLVGALAVAWLLTVGVIVTHRFLVWPVYGALLLLAPGWRQAVAWLLPRERQTRAKEAKTGSPFWTGGLAALLAVGILTALARGWLVGLSWPGEWDSYAIWQFKAKAFFLDGDLSLLRDRAHFSYPHLDYPLLVPLQTWWVYRHLGAISERWAQILGFGFYLDVLALFAAFALRHVSGRIALLGTALLAALPVLTAHAMSGYADVPLTAYLLAIGGCLIGLLVERDAQSAPLLAWMLAGVVLVKNEGMLACLSALAVLAVYVPAMNARRADLKAWPLWIGAAAGAYPPWWLIKQRWHLTSDLFSPEAPLRLTAPLLAWRLGVTLRGFAVEFARIGPRYPCWGLLGPLIPVGLFGTFRRRAALAGPLWLLSLFQLIGYIGIYLITPHPLTYHIASSIERLVLHIAPLLLLGALLACFMPMDAKCRCD